VEELALVMLRSEDPAHWLTRAEKARLYARAILPILRAARERVLEEAARAIENRWRFSKASAAAIRALQEPKV